MSVGQEEPAEYEFNSTLKGRVLVRVCMWTVWRVNATDSQSLVLVGKNEASLIEGKNTVNIRTNDRISVMEGIAPYFTNEHDEITVYLNTALDDDIYTLEFTDDDPQDISTLVVAMEANDYFDLKSKKVVLKNKLVNGSWSLQFEVKDRCGAIGKMTLDVRVNGFQPVEIVSLPSHVSMLATQLTRQMLHTLELKPKAGIFTCAIDSYMPERSTGNPFILQTESSKSTNGLFAEINKFAFSNIGYN
ncbi:hypothetical protein MAR_024227 [Mya arenaria]|uniref:Uncharacterized protein n=1 Tax=Mya arenaria TaxID=6604 RepID=A0ABY7DQ78_MYAAR|nr:hypothetical protein MAR_024227 [Mya arenaria]